MNQLSLIEKYPAEKYNLLGNNSVVVEIPEIQKPVIQVVKLSPNPDDGDVYYFKQNKEYAITKNGLKKLADGAGIKMISSEHVLPASCQKCAAVNAHTGKVIQCGSCKNKDVAYRVTIGVPQLTGEVLTVEDTHEIIVEQVIGDMTPGQRDMFLKHLPQICEAKALNGAIRTALHIKGTYKKEELSKPFIVAYLIPNLDHEDVKRAAIDNMFQSTKTLFGNTPSVQQIESRVPDEGPAAIEAADGENYDEYIDDTYNIEPEPIPDIHTEDDDAVRPQDFCCDRCGEQISQKVWDYSIKHFERPLCYNCQKIVKQQKGGYR